MILYVELVAVFFLIGLFCFGGGYGILPFIQSEVIERGWMTAQEFVNVIAVSESTPGPLGINVATYVGFKMGGIPGAVCSTLGLMLPAFVLVLLVSGILRTEQGNQLWKRFIIGIQPVVVGLILYAAYTIAQSELIKISDGAISIQWYAVILAVIGFFGVQKWKMHPVLLIGTAALLGAIFGI